MCVCISHQHNRGSVISDTQVKTAELVPGVINQENKSESK